MAPTWFGLRGEATESQPRARSDYAESEEEIASARKGWSPTRVHHWERGIQAAEEDTGSSSSLRVDGAQFVQRRTPTGFSQFSPPLQQRRPVSHQPIVEHSKRQSRIDDATGTVDNSYREKACEERGSIEKDRDNTWDGELDRNHPHSAPHHRQHLRKSHSVKTIRKDVPLAELRRLPHGGEEGMIYDRKRTVHTMVTILGGWCALISACFGFKIISIKYHIRAPDFLAEYVLTSPTATTQWFTFSGVLLGEIALILWGHSISYMAFRRLAYGKERTELLTYAAWNEMSRAGYTLSRRRPLWPVFTILIFVGNTFLPAGFSTLLTPKPMVVTVPYKGLELNELSDGFGAAIGFLPASTFPNPANLSCGSQYVSNFWTFQSHPQTIFDPCPSLDDVQTLIMAGRAKLEASFNQPAPLFKLPSSITYVGGTGGISTLGVDGILPFSTWTRPPKHAPTPRGYNYTYVLNQQGLTVDVTCWQPKTLEEKNILTIRMTDVAHLLEVTLKCNVRGTGQDVSYHYIGSSSIILMGCTSKNAQGKDDPDSTIMYFKDAGAEVYGSESELGGDLVCELKPKWTRNEVSYVSDRKWIKVATQADDGPPNRLTGFNGELGPGNHSFSPTSEESKQRFFEYYTRLLTVQGPLAAVGNAFVYTSTLSSLINATLPLSSNHTLAQIENEDSPPSSPSTTISTTVKTWIQPSQVEVFIKGVFEYAATSQREWFQHYAVDGGDFNGPIGVRNGTIPVKGVWIATTVGYGSSTENNDHFVYFSLVPLLVFALISFGMIVWSHWCDAPRVSPYAADIDPTDWLEAVVAASQGGLRYAFAEDALQNPEGLQNARRVRIRLGQIIDREEPKSTPRLGFVCVD
ncbi:hypothetical protein CBS101457_004461 [Exobasidium rhododendri]|nr:hypothetical protein CBS101457_004461 [Exobasidium rhododendri]